MGLVSHRPLIAIPAYHLSDDRVSRWPHGGYGVPSPYVEALRRAGARTAMMAPGEEGDPDELLGPFDGLLLIGGGDVDPSLFGQGPDPELYGVERDRDEMEIELLRAADRLHLPTLCICRGVQVMNVAFGGTLHQHLPTLTGLLEHGVPVANSVATHDVNVDPRSRLFATTKASVLSCSSHHHQGIDRLGDGLVATGWSGDGLVEAIEREGPSHGGTWMVGVQWHPEDTFADDPSQQALFEGLVALARWRGSRAAPGEPEGRTSPYEIVPYDPSWPARFEETAAELRSVLGDLALRIEHIGSTSVPGLGAKDVIDVSVGVPSMEPRSAYLARLTAVGYRHGPDPEWVDHEFFSRGYHDDGFPYRVHVHVCPAGGGFERRHLAFRDWLREHPEDAAAYERLKRELAERHPKDIHTYVDGKSAFISGIEARGLVGHDAAG